MLHLPRSAKLCLEVLFIARCARIASNCVFITIQVCEKCPNVKLERESELLTVHVEPGMEPGQVISFFEEGEPIIDGEVSPARNLCSSSLLVGPAHGFRDSRPVAPGLACLRSFQSGLMGYCRPLPPGINLMFLPYHHPLEAPPVPIVPSHLPRPLCMFLLCCAAGRPQVRDPAASRCTVGAPRQ